ncbi:MAG: GNAT family N-acetyltransferase [Alicyclobacillus herbarius]|uniref:GNAT family N-acetyltransferase n=1 Tax=Alicyclobacillus herbarius TaxID=122960 RepID=UPI0004253487|nr:GNAT family N-acetyltransferase [Alicyclobacillus herbarius]MCL6633953.1 GNAT family N-acetyltransferase [Alicyclobacillus herbarius]
MTHIEYQVNAPVTAEEAVCVYRTSGLRRPCEDTERIQFMLNHADLLVSARDNGRLVGIARALTDFRFYCFITDLAVDADYQKQGIGKGLLQTVQRELGEEVSLVLLSSERAMTYYPHIGFHKAENAWVLPRQR